MSFRDTLARSLSSIAAASLALYGSQALANGTQASARTAAAEKPAACSSAQKAKGKRGKADAKKALDAFQNARTAPCADHDRKIAVKKEGANVKKEKGVEDVE